MSAQYALRPRAVDFQRIWTHLRESIERIVNLQNLDRRTWDDSFSDIYSLCVAIPDPLSELLYNKTKECLENHVSMLYQEVKQAQDTELLPAYYKSWQVYYKGAVVIHNLFGYLNKQFIKSRRQADNDLQYGPLALPNTNDNQLLEIGELALQIWRRVMVAPLEAELVRQLLMSVTADRDGQQLAPVDIVKGVIMSFVQVEEFSSRSLDAEQLNLYREVFEDKFLAATSEHYTAEASRLLNECSCSQYMEKVIQRIEEENARSRKFLHASSFDKVTRMCQDVMVSAHKDRLHAVSKDLIHNEARTDLKNMYVLLKPIPSGLAVLVKEFELYVKKSGLDGVANLKGDQVPQQFVENILQVYNKFTAIVADVFNEDGDFVGALDKALQAAVNFKEESRSCPKASEWLARYTDALLRKSAKGLTEAEVDQKLATAIVIFRYIEDKDIFQKFYSRMLAQRLIYGASVSMDAEESMITKLKQACGYEFTSKLSRMFTDVGLSKDLTDKFLLNVQTKGETLDVQMQILVLQAGAWPLSTNLQAGQMGMAVPTELLPSINMFEEFYTSTYNGRKLTWLFNLANAEVRLNYLDKPYQVTMSVQQLAVLLCFANRDVVTVVDLENETQLTNDTLSKVLRTILDTQILVCDQKDPAVQQYEPALTVHLNETFTSKRLRFKITAPVMQKQVEKETEQVNATVQQDRKYYMECTIVRIMKTRKVLKHNSLVSEVVEQTKSRFTPDINFIKKNIEALIDKQYIQRTDQNDEYQYLA